MLILQIFLAVSILLCTFAMSNRREKAKAQTAQINKQLQNEMKPVRKEKLILEGGKFCLDIAKLILGGVVLASVMQQDVNLWLLISIGLGTVMSFIAFGFILIGKLK